MNREKIGKALEINLRFTEQLNLVLEELGNRFSYTVGTKESGKLRRLSMDLTRALADMRKP